MKFVPINTPIVIYKPPSFNGITNGEPILVHGVNYTEVVLNRAEIGEGNYNINVTVKMYDTFGLDKPDLINFNKHANYPEYE
jgi:hypothetical protein